MRLLVFALVIATLGTLHDGDQPLPSGDRVIVRRGPRVDWIQAQAASISRGHS